MPFQDLQNIFQFNITITDVVKNLFISLIGGYIISLVYQWTYNGPGYSNRFLRSLITITMITSIVILVIGNNLARAFGLVGAMSIIRFRTAVKDTHDIVFIFFALATGLAAGVGLHKITLVGVIFISLIQIILHKLDYGNHKKQEFLLQFIYYPTDETEAEYIDVFKQYCNSNKLINIRSIGKEDSLELSFNVILKKDSDSRELIKSLNKLTQIESVNLFSNENVM